MEHTENIVDVPNIGQAPTLPMPSQTRTRILTGAENWGWLPLLSLVSALGLVLVSIADTLSRSGVGRYELLFWLGLILMVGPVAGRLASRVPMRRERIGLVMLLGLSLFLVKLMHSPQAFTFADELIHMYNATKIVETGHLFSPNPILPVTPYYPGLETVTAALSSLGGLSIFDAGIIVLGVTRIVMMLALFLFIEQVSRSAHVAGLAALLYAAHANFLFWSAQYSYESLALPLAVFVLYMAARRADTVLRSQRIGLTIAAVLAIEAVVLTHHLTSYFLAVFLLVWALMVRFHIHILLQTAVRDLVHWYAGETTLGRLMHSYRQHAVDGIRAARERGWRANLRAAVENRGGTGDLALIALGSTLFWQIRFASITSNYLLPVLTRAVQSMIEIATGDASPRALFQSDVGYDAPAIERLIAFGAVALLLLCMPFGLRKIWQQYRNHAVAILLAGAALLYFAVQGLRFSPAAWETGNRASEFVFLGVAFVAALAIIEGWNSPSMTRWGQGLIMGSIALVFMGGIIAGWPPLLRLSRPLQVKAGNLTVDTPGMEATRWMRETLGPNHGIIADESNGRLMLAYGEQYPLVGRDQNANDIIGTPIIEDWHLKTMRDENVDFVLVDRRLVSWNNMSGYYFDESLSDPLLPRDLLKPEVYQKFDKRPEVGRMVDTGNMVIYDVRTLRNATSVK